MTISIILPQIDLSHWPKMKYWAGIKSIY